MDKRTQAGAISTGWKAIDPQTYGGLEQRRDDNIPCWWFLVQVRVYFYKTLQ